jgi:hypothetical protein
MASPRKPLSVKVTKTCLTCNGFGIVIKSPIMCTNCNGNICYMCESTGGRSESRLQECNGCFGSGNIRTNNNNILSICHVDAAVNNAMLRVGHLTSLPE